MFERAGCGALVAAFDGIEDRDVPAGRSDEIARPCESRDLEPVVVDEAAMQNRLDGRQVDIAKQTEMKVAVEIGEAVLVIVGCRLLHSGEERGKLRHQRA